MKKVTSYEDIAGNLHKTLEECAKRNIVIRLGKLGLTNSAAKDVAEVSAAVKQIICEEQDKYEELVDKD